MAGSDRHSPLGAHALVAAYAGTAAAAHETGPALERLHEVMRGTLLLLWPAGVEPPAEAAALPSQTIRYPDPMSGGHPADAERVVAAIAAARPRDAVVFTEPGESPFVPAYLCYLAGVPRRIGYTSEFGGALLTSALPPPTLPPVERHLALIAALGPDGRAAHAAAAEDVR